MGYHVDLFFYREPEESKEAQEDDVPATLTDYPEYAASGAAQWERVNFMIQAWIINSCSKDVALCIMYASTTAEMWKILERRYTQGNGPRIFILPILILLLLFLPLLFHMLILFLFPPLLLLFLLHLQLPLTDPSNTDSLPTFRISSVILLLIHFLLLLNLLPIRKLFWFPMGDNYAS